MTTLHWSSQWAHGVYQQITWFGTWITWYDSSNNKWNSVNDS